ncbi:MAG: hypothetical protein DWI03_04080 [Planctomycetota bacterium]|jgi:hypothetical protein|nr:MAG: hypothetical protein DWI03_04080 [Planctomycetota bacterium]
MREEELVGYLLEALDDAESRRVETALVDPDQGPGLRRQLEILRRAIRPLERDRRPAPAPAGLAARTLQFVAAQTAADPVRPKPRPSAAAHDGRWVPARGRQWLDRAIIAASALAACILVAPLLLDSVAQSRALRARRNLQQVSAKLQEYAEAHRIYPTPPESGPLSRAGIYAPTLVSEHRLVADDGVLLVPDSALARRGGHRVPTLDELRAAMGTPQFDELVRSMGGDYGYTLGHRDAAGVLQPNRNLRRAHHPLMADAPDEGGEASSNHPEGIHHVLFEDGHVETHRVESLHRDDHLYRNHDGESRAGKDLDDAVIGDSHHQP